MMKVTKKRILSSMLVLLMMLTVLSTLALTALEPEAGAHSVFNLNMAEEVNSTPCCYDCAFGHRLEGYSIDGIREYLSDGGSIYEYLRIHSENDGTRTYRIPMTDSYIEDLISLQSSNIQPLNANPFKTERVMYSGLPHADSIVIIILSDGFAEDEYDIVFDHAESVMNTMLDTHPFGLFSHLFTAYVIHTHGTNDATGIGYLATIQYLNGWETVAGTSTIFHDHRRIRTMELANSVVPPQYQNMIQIISNASGTGWAWSTGSYLFNTVSVAATATNPNSFPPGGGGFPWHWDSGKLWHGTFIHEFGHSFGQLVDEHDGARRSEHAANSTAMPGGELKWCHWVGHRSVESPVPFNDGWLVPARFMSETLEDDGCMMSVSSINRNFCGVCTAELIRRLAVISRETFHGRSPVTDPPANSPNYPRVRTPVIRVAEGTIRILDSAFHGNASIETVHIPASVEIIGDFAFIGTTNLRTIHNSRTVPQQINETTFAGIDRSLVTVRIPIGTTQAYLDAGWKGFILVEDEGAPEFTITFHAYGVGEFMVNGEPTDRVVVPVVFDDPIDLSVVHTYMLGNNDEGLFAFWGWFFGAGDEQTAYPGSTLSARTSMATGISRNRPYVGSQGFPVPNPINLAIHSTPATLVFTETRFNELARVDGSIHLYAIWSLWGDVDDNDRVDPVDANLLFQHVGQVYGAPTINLPPADVFRDGRVDPIDANILFQHVSHTYLPPPPHPRPPPPMPSDIETAQWQISYDASSSSETLSVEVGLYETTQHGMGLTLLTVQYDSSLLSNPRIVPNSRLDRESFNEFQQQVYERRVAAGYTEAELALLPIFACAVEDVGAYHNNFVFEYILYPNHLHGPDVILLGWLNSRMSTPYLGSDIFVNIEFDVANGADLDESGAVWFNDGLQYMGWAVGVGANSLLLYDGVDNSYVPYVPHVPEAPAETPAEVPGTGDGDTGNVSGGDSAANTTGNAGSAGDNNANVPGNAGSDDVAYANVSTDEATSDAAYMQGAAPSAVVQESVVTPELVDSASVPAFIDGGLVDDALAPAVQTNVNEMPLVDEAISPQIGQSQFQPQNGTHSYLLLWVGLAALALIFMVNLISRKASKQKDD